MNRPLRTRALALAVTFSSLVALTRAAPYTYKEANNYSAQLQRAFNSAPTSYTVPVYKSTINGSGSSSSSGSSNSSSSGSSRSGGGFASPSDSYSWGMPSRQTGYNWGPGYVLKPDPDGDKIAAARVRTWELPTPPLADASAIARYYQSRGVSTSRAHEAARSDVIDHIRAKDQRDRDAKWAAYDREQLRISQYRASQNAGRAAFLTELAAVRARALASGGGDPTGLGADPAAAEAWLDLAGRTQMWRGTYIEHDPLARRAAVFFAARAGVPLARIAAWGEAKDAGEDVAYWHAQAVLAGDIEAITAFHQEIEKNPAVGFARAAALYERAYEIMPAKPSSRDGDKKAGAARALCAFHLAGLYTRGGTDLPSDPARALAWAKKTPSPAPDSWQSQSIYSRAKALRQLETNILTARALEKEIVAEWESLLAAGTEANAVRTALYPIYLGRHPAFPTSADPAKARALYPDGPDDLKMIIDAGDWPAAAKFEDLPFARHPSLPFLLGRLWRERTDGNRDLARARAAFIHAISGSDSDDGNGEAAIAISEIQLELGERSLAQLTLERTLQHRLPLSRWRVQLRLALGFYRGDYGEIGEKDGDTQMALLAKATATLPGLFRDQEEKFVRDFTFQRIAAPLLARFNRLESLRRNVQNLTAEHLEDIARQHRENLAPALPALRTLALAGYAPATRLWAMLTLSPYATPTPADAGLAKTFLFQSALGGDAPAVVILAQRLYRDAQEARLAPDATPARLRDQFAEAAAWLEAAWKTGHPDALRPLYTIYHENLGGLGSAEKSEQFHQALAAAGDQETAAERAEREFAELLPPPPAATLTPAQLQTARAERFALVKKLAETDDPDHPVGRRELERMILRGDQDAAFTEAGSALAALVPARPPATPAALFALVEQLAQTGNPAAQRELALMRFRGEGTPKDASEQSGEVLFLLEKAAKAGDFTAALWRAKIQYLGLYHEAGQRDAATIMQDRFQAGDFLQDLAHHGSPLMRYRVGLLYLNDKKREPECFLEAEPAFLDRAHLLLEKARDEGVTAAEAPLAQAAAQLGR